jgi:hypothetical protein
MVFQPLGRLGVRPWSYSPSCSVICWRFSSAVATGESKSPSKGLRCGHCQRASQSQATRGQRNENLGSGPPESRTVRSSSRVSTKKSTNSPNAPVTAQLSIKTLGKCLCVHPAGGLVSNMAGELPHITDGPSSRSMHRFNRENIRGRSSVVRPRPGSHSRDSPRA